MSYANTMYALTNLSCGLISVGNFINQRNMGVPMGFATMDLAANLSNGITRNYVAKQMQEAGDSRGNYINTAVGYGNPISNTIGTLALASIGMNNPRMWFGGFNNFMYPTPISYWMPIGYHHHHHHHRHHYCC